LFLFLFSLSLLTPVSALLESWEIKPTDLTLGRVLGKGSFGQVLHARWCGQDVAVKQLLRASRISCALEQCGFGKEATMLMRLHHPNIVQFFGAGVMNGRPFLVMEFFPLGPLSVYLATHAAIPWSCKLGWALGLARGLAFLHGRGHVHRDVKADNVMLGRGLEVKLADFGLGKLLRLAQQPVDDDDDDDDDDRSKLLPASRTAQAAARAQRGRGDGPRRLGRWHRLLRLLQGRSSGADSTCLTGTPLWMAPEVMDTLGDFDTQPTDVYSYGITLWEIAAQQLPFQTPQVFGASLQTASSVGGRSLGSDILTQIRGGLRPELGAWPENVCGLMVRCWQGSPASRPSMADVERELSGIVSTL
jgi:serine/threonine protein kinase